MGAVEAAESPRAGAVVGNCGNCGNSSGFIRGLVRRVQQEQARKRLRDPIEEARTRVAMNLANATNTAHDQIERDPGIGSPTLDKLLGMPGLRIRRVVELPLLWCCLERGDQFSGGRLLGERQDIAASLGEEFAADCRRQGRTERKSSARKPGRGNLQAKQGGR